MKLTSEFLREVDRLTDYKYGLWDELLARYDIGWTYRTDPHHGGKVVDEVGRFIKDFWDGNGDSL